MTDRRVAAALGAVGLWSTNAYAADLALHRMTVGWLLLIQFGTASAVFAALRTGRQATSSRLGWSAVGVGVAGLSATIFLQYVAFALAPIVAANVLAYAWPLLAALWVAATRRSAASLAGAGLAAVGFAGVALIFTAPGSGAGGAGGNAGWGYAAAAGSALCMAFYTLRSGRLAGQVGALLLPAMLVGAGAAALLVAVRSGPVPSVGGVAAAAYLGAGPMAAGYGLWTRAMADGGATRLAALGYATPMLSTALLLATGAPATTTTLVGVGIVLFASVGVLAVDRAHRRQVAASVQPDLTGDADGQAAPAAVRVS